MTYARQRKDGQRRKREQDSFSDSIVNDDAIEWSVAASGYECRNVEDFDSNGAPITYRAVVPKNNPDAPEAAARRMYKPVAEAGLLFDLANLPANEQSIVEFASRYGLLINGSLLALKDDPNFYVLGEPISIWTETIAKLRRAVRLWSLIQNDDTSGILKELAWEPLPELDPFYGGQLFPRNRKVAKPKSAQENLTYYINRSKQQPDAQLTDIGGTESPTDLARRHVQLQINRELASHCPTFIVYSVSTHRYICRVVPSSLVGCVWWQLARAFVGLVRYKACRACGGPIEVGKEGRQSNREFCSAACRQKDHRDRVNRANQLAMDGLEPSVIAKKMDMAESTIANWLTKRQRKR